MENDDDDDHHDDGNEKAIEGEGEMEQVNYEVIEIYEWNVHKPLFHFQLNVKFLWMCLIPHS